MEVTAEDLRGQGCLVPAPLSHFLPVGGVRGYVNHLVLHLLPTENCLDVVLLRVQLQRVKSNIRHSLDVVLLRTHATNRACVCESVCVCVCVCACVCV